MNSMLTSFRWKLGFMNRKYLYMFYSLKRGIIESSENFKPLIIAPISGGLGNQIWHYAVGALISHYSGLPVKYDNMWNYRQIMDINGKEVRNFTLPILFPNIVINEATKEESFLYKRYFWREPKYQCVFEKDICFSKRARYLGGFYANAQYMTLFTQDFWEQFKMNPELSYENNIILEQIKNVSSVALHIRRGDYIGSIHDVISLQYYERAVNFLNEKLKPTFFVFSDDLSWAKKALNKLQGNFIYINHEDNNNDIADFFLMSQCQHYIMANSTFSWMAAWLGKKDYSIVIMPDKWFNKKAPKHIFYNNEKAFYVDGYKIIQC